MNPMLEFHEDLDEPAYAYLWQDDEDLDDDLNEDHPSLSAGERNPSLCKSWAALFSTSPINPKGSRLNKFETMLTDCFTSWSTKI